jgi:hypothetical protein
MGELMKKTLENARKAIITNTEKERILEQSGILSSKLTEREKAIADYLFSELIVPRKIGLGYQFGLKRFNAMFVNWNNGKATDKASVIPTVKEISNACKSLYKECKEFEFFPIVKTNSDGAIIIDCVKWVAEFYSETKPKKASEKKEKPIELDYDALILGLQELDIETLSELKTEIESILKSRVNVVKKSA